MKNGQQVKNCAYCNAEIPEGNRFCVKCGKSVETDIIPSENSVDKNICPNCYTEVEPNLRFCTQCGTKIEKITTSKSPTTCPHCYAEINPGLRFCTKCGKEITQGSSYHTTCPKCYTDNEPGLKFCTKCGTSLKVKIEPTNENINRELAKRRSQYKTTDSDESLDTIVQTGKDVINELGGFLNKVSSSLDNKSSKSPSTRTNTPRIAKPQKENPGYLICDKCGGYYELQPGEAPENFSDQCECGGKLKFSPVLEEGN